jgi:hypothetical protein
VGSDRKGRSRGKAQVYEKHHPFQSKSKVRIPIAMQRDLRQRRCTMCGSDIFISKDRGTAQFLTPFFLSL